MILTFWRSVFVWSAVTVPLQMKTILLLRQQFEENLFKTNQKIGFLYLKRNALRNHDNAMDLYLAFLRKIKLDHL